MNMTIQNTTDGVILPSDLAYLGRFHCLNRQKHSKRTSLDSFGEEQHPRWENLTVQKPIWINAVDFPPSLAPLHNR